MQAPDFSSNQSVSAVGLSIKVHGPLRVPHKGSFAHAFVGQGMGASMCLSILSVRRYGLPEAYSVWL